MTDREKVINGLEYCSKGPVGCQTECPYKRDFGCRSQLSADALALLKAQEPRVLTLEEYREIAEMPREEREPVWEEWMYSKGEWKLPEKAYGGYGSSWRCWTSRPTDAQMEAIPWGD